MGVHLVYSVVWYMFEMFPTTKNNVYFIEVFVLLTNIEIILLLHNRYWEYKNKIVFS